MFKKTNPNPQLDISTALSIQLSDRAFKRNSGPSSWFNLVYSLMKTKIDKMIFKPLFIEGKKIGFSNVCRTHTCGHIYFKKDLWSS